MRQVLLKFGLLSSLVIFLGTVAFAQTITFAYTLTATLTGSNVATPVETTGSGTVIAVLVGNELTVTGVYHDLSSPLQELGWPLAGVAISVAPPGEQARPEIAKGMQTVTFDTLDMILDHTGGTSGTFSGVFNLTNEQLQKLGDGLFYIQLYTRDNRNGELRAQLTSEIDLGFNAEDMVGTWVYDGGQATYRADGTAQDGGYIGTWTYENHILTRVALEENTMGCAPGAVDVFYVEAFQDGTRRTRDVSIGCHGVGGGWLTLWK